MANNAAMMSSMSRVSSIRVVAVVSSGLMAGLLFGDWLGPSFARSAMNESSFVQFQQIVHINYLRMLPALSTVAIAAPILWLIILRTRGDTAEFKILLGATVAVAIGYTITFVFNVPVNNQLETWNFTAAPPADAVRFGANGRKLTWREQFSGWWAFSWRQLLWLCLRRVKNTLSNQALHSTADGEENHKGELRK